MSGHNESKNTATQDTQLQQQTLNTAGNTSIPFVQNEVQHSADVMNKIRAGDYSSLDLVKAVNQGADAARQWKPQVEGDAALAASANGVGGYAAQQEAYRQRQLTDKISSLVPAAVEAERSNAEGELFPGAGMISSFDLSKAAGYGGAAGTATNLYQAEMQNSFANQFKNTFARSLGSSLGNVTGSYNNANGAWSGGFG